MVKYFYFKYLVFKKNLRKIRALYGVKKYTNNAVETPIVFIY